MIASQVLEERVPALRSAVDSIHHSLNELLPLIDDAEEKAEKKREVDSVCSGQWQQVLAAITKVTNNISRLSSEGCKGVCSYDCIRACVCVLESMA